MAIPTDVQKRIDDMYNQQKNTQLAELRASQQKAVGQVNTQKTETGQQYYDKRNQSDVTHFQGRKALQEMMAASGLNGSGENLSGQISLNAARQNALGRLNREEQNIMGSLNQRINEINDPSRANQIVSAIEAQRSAALAEAIERAIQRQREQERFEEEKRQFEARLAWEKEQFNRQMAEQAARAARSGGGGGRRSASRGSTSKAPKGQDKSLGQLLEEFRGSDQSGLPILQKRSVVSSRVPLVSGMGNARSFGGGSSRPTLAQY